VSGGMGAWLLLVGWWRSCVVVPAHFQTALLDLMPVAFD